MAKSNNIGDQVRDAIQDAIDSQDFSNLKNTIEHSIGSAADAIGQGLRQAAAAAQEFDERQKRERAAIQWREQERLRLQQEASIRAARFESTSSKRAVGFIAAIAGGLFAPGSAFMVLIGLTAVFAVMDLASLMALGVCILAAGASVALLIAGIGQITLMNRFEAYQNVLMLRQACALQELALQTARPEQLVLKDVRKLIAKGMFKQGHTDDQETQLIVTDEAYAQYRAQANALQARQQKQLQDAQAKQQAEQRRLASGQLTDEARAILEKGETYIRQIRLSNDAIPGEDVSAKIDQIESVVRSIFKHAEEHPEVIPELDRLMDYYLPTTIKLLDAYESLDRQPVQGQNIKKSKVEIEAALDSLSVAFSKLLDSIFVDMAWDVSTDVSVLHTVLAQEGLVEGPFAGKKK